MTGAIPLALILSAVSFNSGQAIQAHYTEVRPVIDGILEDLWQNADSATGFIQQTPDNGNPATESTTVYLLYDQENIYVAFRCLVHDLTTVHDRLSEEPDGVQVVIDPFDDNTTGYSFTVGFNGVESDCRITADGVMTENWDGVWWSAVRKYDWGYGVEMLIPFKSLRYPRGKHDWRIDFGRFVIGRAECSFWSKHEITGFKVSRMGRLTGINPPARHLGLEVYPVGLVRQEKSGNYKTGWRDEVRAEAGLDLAYSPTPGGNLQLTVLPDFAQIEADPYQVNLSRYELWLSERRPFFVEAVETFGGSQQPVKVFYSRRIGKPLPDGRAVPIITGVKWTERAGRTQYGFLGALTGECETEPQSYYSIFAARHRLLTNSELGAIYAGKDNRAFSNHGLGLDVILRSDRLHGRIFTAGSQFGESLDYALSLDGGYESENFAGGLTLRQIQPEFNMNGTGYTTWRGQYGSFYAGPVFYNRSLFRLAMISPGVEIQREWDYPPGTATATGFINSSARFKNQYYLSLWGGYGQDWALSRLYRYSYTGFYFASDYTRPVTITGYTNYYTRTANYRRGQIAPVFQAEINIQARLGDRWKLWLGDDVTVEADSLSRINIRQDLTSVLRPGVEHSFNARAALRLSLQTVFSYDQGTDRRTTQNSLFALYSWTFAPRSTFYFASNLGYTERELSTIFVAKIRYLFNI